MMPPKGYIKALSKAIVGIELATDVIEGKWKVSQNRSESDKQGAIAGLRAIGSPRAVIWQGLNLNDETGEKRALCPHRGCASRPGKRARANRLRHLLTI
jgi:hypothetical protein